MRFEVSRPHSGILASVVALLFLVGVLPLVLFGVQLTRFNRRHLESQQKEIQLSIAEATAQEVGEFVRSRTASVHGFAQGLEAALSLHGARITPDGSQELVRRLLADDADILKVVLALRSEGEGATRRVDFVAAQKSEDPNLYAKAEEALVERLLEPAFEGRAGLEAVPGAARLLVIAQPIRVGAELPAVVAAVVSLADLQQRLEAGSQQLYSISITDQGAARFLANSRHSFGVTDELSSDLFRAFRAGGGTRTMPFRLGDRDMLGAFATVPGTGWGVFVEIDAATAYYAVANMREKTILWSLASLLLALILGTFFAGRIVRPIRELAAGAYRLARGDFSRRIEIRSGNEIGLLAQSFNHMADEIKEQLGALETAARENKELFLASIRMLAEAIDEKDPYTRGHSERVTRYAVAVARSLGLTPEEVERVQLGALLHDVGKIGIDDRILRKPSVLTDEEFEIMKQHPEKGAHIMGAVRQLADIVPGMRFHHEKVDGTGYPLGLRGEEIPLAAQIISVADTFDAMTTDRPYQKGMDPEFVVGKLRGWIGTRFRGDVVEAFDAAFREGMIEVRRRAQAGTAPLSRARAT